MMSHELLLRGRHPAEGVVLDTTTAGLRTTQERVFELWDIADAVYRLDENRWFVRFNSPVELLSASVAGALVVSTPGGGLSTAPDLLAEPGTITYWDAGVRRQASVGQLERLDPSEWVTLAGDVAVLSQPALPVVDEIIEVEHVVAPDFRTAANLGEEREATQRFAKELQTAQMIAAQEGFAAPNAGRGGGAGSGGARSAPRRAAKPPKPKRNRLAERLWNSPARKQITRKHQRYLEDLEDRFVRQDFDEALRRAIPMGGKGLGGLSLRLPKRRDDLRLTAGSTGSSGGSVPYGLDVAEHLEAMYRKAADELERLGRIDEAAFILAELLSSPLDCVNFLVRHDRHRAAAEFAEARNLEPDLVVRLWWQAGDRERAILLARRHGVFASVVRYLEQHDPEAARDFRLHWVDYLDKSGNLHGAIAVGWPDPTLREFLLPPILRGIRANDDFSVGLRAYLCALKPEEEVASDFIEAVGDPDLSGQARSFTAEALAVAECPDPVLDRKMCSAAARVLNRAPRPDPQLDPALRPIFNRADPVLVADLPTRFNQEPNEATVVIPSIRGGVVPVLDVVALTSGSLVTAHGDGGVRLSGFDGKTKGEWPTRCTSLVASDHEKSVLVLSRGEHLVEVSVLDLVTRKMRYYGTIHSTLWAHSFDGATWTVRGSDGRLWFFDILADKPTVVWRELDVGMVCHSLARSPNQLAALVAMPPTVTSPQVHQVWAWETPKMRLDVRRRLADHPPAAMTVFPDGYVMLRGVGFWQLIHPSGKASKPLNEEHMTFQPRGALLSYRVRPELVVSTTLERLLEKLPPLAAWEHAEQAWGSRRQGNLLAMWIASGTLGVVDISRSELVAAHAVRAD